MNYKGTSQIPMDCTSLAAKLKPLLASVDYTASEAFDGMNPNSEEFVLVMPITALFKSSGEKWKERKIAFAERSEKAGEILRATGAKVQRDSLNYYVRP